MSDTEIPMKPLYAGHSEVYDRYCQLRGEGWVERVDRETTVYEFARAFVDSRRQHDLHEITNDTGEDQ